MGFIACDIAKPNNNLKKQKIVNDEELNNPGNDYLKITTDGGAFTKSH